MVTSSPRNRSKEREPYIQFPFSRFPPVQIGLAHCMCTLFNHAHNADGKGDRTWENTPTPVRDPLKEQQQHRQRSGHISCCKRK